MLHKAIYQALKTNATVNTLTDGRIYWLNAPQSVTFPCVTWQLITANDFPSFRGESELHRGELIIDVWTDTRDNALAGEQVWTLATAVRDCLAGYTTTDYTYDNTTVCFIFQSEEDSTAEIDEGAQIGDSTIYRRSLSYMIFYKHS